MKAHRTNQSISGGTRRYADPENNEMLVSGKFSYYDMHPEMRPSAQSRLRGGPPVANDRIGGKISQVIADWLRENGPATVTEVAAGINHDPHATSAAIRRVPGAIVTGKRRVSKRRYAQVWEVKK